MAHTLVDAAKKLSNDELLARPPALAGSARKTLVELVAHLAELDLRQLHLKAGYGSLFVYCRDALHLSEHEAYNRIEAARAARRFPLVLDLLADGSINLTTVRLLAGHLTDENHVRVLRGARRKRKPEVEEMVATLAPRPDAPSTLRKLPSPGAAVLRLEDVISKTATAASAPIPRPVPAATAPLSPDRYRLQVTITGATVEKLRLAADMLGHASPSGDGAALIDRALTLLLADLARRKFAVTDTPRPGRAADPHSRHIPAEVRRAVWVRDLGRCTYLGDGGRRCEERRFIEFDHVRPYAAGGPPTVENVRLLCRRHNQLEAEAYFGRLPREGVGEVHEPLPSYPFWNECEAGA